jgi:hypothetical protein
MLSHEACLREEAQPSAGGAYRRARKESPAHLARGEPPGRAQEPQEVPASGRQSHGSSGRRAVTPQEKHRTIRGVEPQIGHARRRWPRYVNWQLHFQIPTSEIVAPQFPHAISAA